jgi:predicted Zn-dependent protease
VAALDAAAAPSGSDAAVAAIPPFDAASPASVDAASPSAVDPELDQIDAEMASASAGEGAGAVVEEPAAEVPTPPAPPAAARPIRRAEDAARLIRQGRHDEALSGLLRLRRQQPKAGYVHYLIGNLYFQRRSWTNALDSYRVALRHKPAYRRYRSINANAIRALASDRTRRNATSLILRSIGKAALPFLRRAAAHDKNPKVRKRAAFLAKKLASRRR